MMFLAALLPVLSIALRAESYPFDEEWRWVHFTTESGLPSNFVTGIVETQDGTVWVATSAGIAWFDGYQWVRIDPSLGLPPGPPVSMVADASDSLLVIVGRNLYRGTRRGFRLIPLEGVSSCVPLGSDSLLIQMGQALVLYDRGEIRPFERFPHPRRGHAKYLWRTKSGGVWLSPEGGLYKWEEGDWKRKIGPDSVVFAFNNQILVENERGVGLTSIYLPFERRGLWEWEEGGLPRAIKKEGGGFIKAADIGPDDQVMTVHESGQVRIRQRGVWSTVSFKHLNIRDIECISYRKNGDLWVGTQRGLYLFRQSSSRWRYLSYDSPNPRNSINEILKTQKGDLWLATADGVVVHSHAGGTASVSRIGGRDLYVVTGLAEDAKGGIWISSGSAFPGVYRWDGVSWEHFGPGTPLEGIKFHKIARDRKGRLWFLGIWDMLPPTESTQPGAFVYDGSKFVPWGLEQGLTGGRVYAFEEGADGALWFGTIGGLNRWKNGKWTHWPVWANPQSGHSERVFTLAIGLDGKVWFSDRRSGVGYVDERDSITYLGNDDGLVNNEVWDMRVDSNGKLWFTTAAGLSCYNNGIWSSFNSKTGLTDTHLWPVLPLHDLVYVGSLGSGVSILNQRGSSQPPPQLILDPPVSQGRSVLLRWKALAYWGDPSPQEIPTRYRINDEEWSPWSTNRTVTFDELEPGKYTFQVQAKGLFGDFDKAGQGGAFVIPLPTYANPAVVVPIGSLLISVIIIGVLSLTRKRKHDLMLRASEAKFRSVAETTPSAIFIYRNDQFLFLNPGAEALTGYSQEELFMKRVLEIVHPGYRRLFVDQQPALGQGKREPRRFELRIITKDGIERWIDYSEGVVEFEGGMAFLGTAFDISEGKRAETKLLANQEHLRSLASELVLTEERERRRMATFLHDTIGQALAISKMKLGVLQKATSSVGLEKEWNEIRSLLDQSIQNTRSLTFELSPPVLNELGFVAAVEWLVEQMRDQHRLKFVVDNDKQEKPLRDDVRFLLFNAVRELLINVVKHARAKNVTIRLRREGGSIRIQIEDDGIGYTTSGASGSRNGGFGLLNIRERLGHLGGGFEIESRPGRGTRITLVAPLQPTEQAA